MRVFNTSGPCDPQKHYPQEMINNKRIYTYIILTNFERPSRRRKGKRDTCCVFHL